MKILLYGGCHALIIRDLIETLVDPASVELSLLINFQLIESGAPFPCERLDWCDIFIYSPIENKGGYNTDLLLAECRARHVEALCFPWMEWHGYCPGAVKGLFKGRYQWFYPGLLDVARRFDSFEPFVADVIAHHPSNEVIDRTFVDSTERVASSEARHGMMITISDFIAANYRASRLFLISDHPSIALYLHVTDQILGHLRLARQERATASEPQWRWRTPILPRVAERLDLGFTDTQWIDDEMIPGRASCLECYLSLYFHRDSVVLGPVEDAEIVLGIEQSEIRESVSGATRIVASPLGRDARGSLDEYVCLETFSESKMALRPNARFAIDARQWRSTWSF